MWGPVLILCAPSHSFLSGPLSPWCGEGRSSADGTAQHQLTFLTWQPCTVCSKAAGHPAQQAVCVLLCQLWVCQTFFFSGCPSVGVSAVTVEAISGGYFIDIKLAFDSSLPVVAIDVLRTHGWETCWLDQAPETHMAACYHGDNYIKKSTSLQANNGTMTALW